MHKISEQVYRGKIELKCHNFFFTSVKIMKFHQHCITQHTNFFQLYFDFNNVLKASVYCKINVCETLANYF